MIRLFFCWALTLLLAATTAASLLFWPLFVDWAVIHTGWSRQALMPDADGPGPVLVPVVACGIVTLMAFFWAVFTTIAYLADRASAELQRLHAQDQRATTLSYQLKELQGALETCQKERAIAQKALEEATKRTEPDTLSNLVQQIGAMAKGRRAISSNMAGAGGGVNNGPYISAGVGGSGISGTVAVPWGETIFPPLFKDCVTIRPPRHLRSARVEWPNGEVTVYEKGMVARPEKMVGAPEPACGEAPEPAAVGGPVPYRIKAEPLKISDLRDGDEVVFIGASTEMGVGSIVSIASTSLLVIEHRPGGTRYTIEVSQVLGILRRIGS